jgi:translation initiation factor 2 subunit 3
MLTGKWTDTHSEELKRGISIRLGYADIVFKKCPNCGLEGYSNNDKCSNCSNKAEPYKRVSFVDSPGHESLMATMLSGCAIINGAILVVAANEDCPQPRTVEHLLAAKYSNIEKLIVVQNKIDLVTEEQAKTNYDQIVKFLKEIGYENVPIIPVSANHNINKDVLIYAITNYFSSPEYDLNKNLKMYVVRSFDVNRPGAEIEKLIGGVIGGSIVEGKLKIGDSIEIAPGVDNKYLTAKVLSLNTEFGKLEEAGPGGLIAIGTSLDPCVAQNDKLKGQIVGHLNELPKPKSELNIELHTIDRLLVDDMKKPLIVKEPLIVTLGTGTALGTITSIKPGSNLIKFIMKNPVVVEDDQKVSLSRRSSNGWRLYGYGFIRK